MVRLGESDYIRCSEPTLYKNWYGALVFVDFGIDFGLLTTTKMRFIIIIAVTLCWSCKNGTPPPDPKPLGRHINKISFKEKEIDVIKDNFQVVDSIFRIMSNRKKIPITKTGYAAYDTVFYYENCSRKGQYMNMSECQLDTILSHQEIEKCNKAIQNLMSFGFHTCEYDTALGEFGLLLDAGFEDDRDYLRVLIKDKIDSDFVSKSSLKLIDSKNGLRLLKTKG